jgi:methyl-accepting chemotaxis protein
MRRSIRSLPGQLTLAFGGVGALTLVVGMIAVVFFARQNHALSEATRAAAQPTRRLATGMQILSALRGAEARVETSRRPEDAERVLAVLDVENVPANLFSDLTTTGDASAGTVVTSLRTRWQDMARAWSEFRSAVARGESARDVAVRTDLRAQFDSVEADLTRALIAESAATERATPYGSVWTLHGGSLIVGLVFLTLLCALSSVLLFSRSVGCRVHALLVTTSHIADGALGARLPVEGEDELAQLAGAFNRMTGTLADTLTRMRRTVSYLEKQSGELTEVATRQNRVLTAQAASVAEIAGTVAELASSARNVQDGATSTVERAHAALESARQGRSAVARGVAEMRVIRERAMIVGTRIAELTEKTRLIGEIVDVVRGIAAKTDMLAINAAVEAARAGEQGRGFAVVASEVRKLSDQSQRATEKIAGMLAEIQSATAGTVAATEEGSRSADEGLALLEQTGNSIDALHMTLADAVAAVQEIALTAKQQAIAVEQVAENMAGVNDGMDQTREGSSEMLHVARSLVELGANLSQTVAQYRLDEQPAAGLPARNDEPSALAA